jgi:hypothetical protein
MLFFLHEKKAHQKDYENMPFTEESGLQILVLMRITWRVVKKSSAHMHNLTSPSHRSKEYTKRLQRAGSKKNWETLVSGYKVVVRSEERFFGVLLHSTVSSRDQKHCISISK